MMRNNQTLLLDFDSTIVQVESLDLLSEITLFGGLESKKKILEVKELTNLGMNGVITFQESLQKRLDMIQASKKDVELLSNKLINFITPSFSENSDWIIKNSDKVHIFSGGFKEAIIPVARIFNIPEERVHANEFIYSKDDKIEGVDTINPFSRSGGKVERIKELGLSGEIIMVGDGSTDAEVKILGNEFKFIAFIENVRRDPVLEKADFVAKTFEDVINFISQTD
jgi:D-3-phosphoglycerate dehydrogenase